MPWQASYRSLHRPRQHLLPAMSLLSHHSWPLFTQQAHTQQQGPFQQTTGRLTRHLRPSSFLTAAQRGSQAPSSSQLQAHQA